MRPSKRGYDELRAVSIKRDVLKYAWTSCEITLGDTVVLCSTSVESKVPNFLRKSGTGWVTAEYAMLPCSTPERHRRDSSLMKGNGRSIEIQRLIGRSLRAVTDLKLLGERTILVDCDVVQADGGTRCAAITGAWIALYACFEKMKIQMGLRKNPLTEQIAALSCGYLDGNYLLDLDYEEDHRVWADSTFVSTANAQIVEVQISSEKHPLPPDGLQTMLNLTQTGIQALMRAQRESLGIQTHETPIHDTGHRDA